MHSCQPSELVLLRVHPHEPSKLTVHGREEAAPVVQNVGVVAAGQGVEHSQDHLPPEPHGAPPEDPGVQESPADGHCDEEDDEPHPRCRGPIRLRPWRQAPIESGSACGGGIVLLALRRGVPRTLLLEALELGCDNGIREVEAVLLGVLDHLRGRVVPVHRGRPLPLLQHLLCGFDLLVQLSRLFLLAVAHVKVAQQLGVRGPLLQGIVVADVLYPLVQVLHLRLVRLSAGRDLFGLQLAHLVDGAALKHPAEGTLVLLALHLPLLAQPDEEFLHDLVLGVRLVRFGEVLYRQVRVVGGGLGGPHTRLRPTVERLDVSGV
mmetsp:Transcript_159388/g.487707  ORF Transcript_159388/g.487707 Transcript_159388/m.487707 type:complete len:320 (+) Transcript_159388:2-961(+)